MKVLHIFKTYYPESHGGIENVVQTLAKGMTRHDVEAEVLTTSTEVSWKDKRVHQGVIVNRFRRDLQFSSTGFSLAAFINFRTLIKSFDLLHFHYPNPFGDILYLLAGKEIPKIVTYHADIISKSYLRKLYKPLERAFLSGMNAIVATSDNYVNSSNIVSIFCFLLSDDILKL